MIKIARLLVLFSALFFFSSSLLSLPNDFSSDEESDDENDEKSIEEETLSIIKQKNNKDKSKKKFSKSQKIQTDKLSNSPLFVPSAHGPLIGRTSEISTLFVPAAAQILSITQTHLPIPEKPLEEKSNKSDSFRESVQRAPSANELIVQEVRNPSLLTEKDSKNESLFQDRDDVEQIEDLKSKHRLSLFLKIPKELRIEIYKYLPNCDQNLLSQTCKTLNSDFKHIDEIRFEKGTLSNQFLNIIFFRSSFLKKLILSEVKMSREMEETFKKDFKKCDKFLYLKHFEHKYICTNIFLEHLLNSIKSVENHQLESLILKNYSEPQTSMHLVKVLSEVIQSGHLKNLTHLDLSANGIQPEGLELLCQAIKSGLLNSLKHLDLYSNSTSEMGIKSLVNVMKLGHLRNLTHARFDNLSYECKKIIAEFLNFGFLPNLLYLNVGTNGFENIALKYLNEAIASDYLRNFTFLEVTFLENEEILACEFFRCIKLGKLNQLNHLKCIMIDLKFDCIELLADAIQSENLKNLTHFHVISREVTQEGMRKIFDCMAAGYLKNLKFFAISSMILDNKKADFFFVALSSGHFRKLNHLSLNRNKIGKEGIKSFAEIIKLGHLDNLTYLDLICQDMGDEGFMALIFVIELGYLEKLKCLKLSDNGISDKSLIFFFRVIGSGHLRELGSLDLLQNDITDEGKKILYEAIQKAKLKIVLTPDINKPISRWGW